MLTAAALDGSFMDKDPFAIESLHFLGVGTI